jgi:peptidoglycan/xylan/chitin deacetylase (PgdA/CDA1 family)
MRIDPLTALLHRNSGQHGPVMLMYHAILPAREKPTWPWAVSMQQFRDQLDFLASEGYATPTMSELVTAPEKFPGRTAAITFDDGYVDNLGAYEELAKRGMRATWFIVSGSIGRPPAWPADGRPHERLLNPSELQEMHAGSMEIGSHTVSHVRLPEVDDARLAEELTASKAALEDVLGNAISSFAYPYGAWDKRCADATRQAGYIAACTTDSGWSLRDNNPYRLRRLTLFNTDTASSLARKLLLARNDVSWKTLSRHYLQQAKSRLWIGAS